MRIWSYLYVNLSNILNDKYYYKIVFQFLLFLLNDPSRNLTDSTLSEGRAIKKKFNVSVTVKLPFPLCWIIIYNVFGAHIRSAKIT